MNTSSVPSLNMIGEDNASACAANSQERIDAIVKFRKKRGVTQQQVLAKDAKKKEKLLWEAPVVRFMLYNYPHIREVMSKDIQKAIYKRITKREMFQLRESIQGDGIGVEEHVAVEFKSVKSRKHELILEELLLFVNRYLIMCE